MLLTPSAIAFLVDPFRSELTALGGNRSKFNSTGLDSIAVSVYHHIAAACDKTLPEGEAPQDDFNDALVSFRILVPIFGFTTSVLARIRVLATEYAMDLVARNPRGPTPAVAAEYAQKAILVGAEAIEHSRTVALLVSSMLEKPALRRWDPNDMLKDALCDTVERAVYACFRDAGDLREYGATGLDALPGSLSAVRRQMVCAAAFAGDLLALDVLPAERVHALVLHLICGLHSATHCRALYVLLGRAKWHSSDAFPGDSPGTWHAMLCEKKTDAFFAENAAAKRWLAEPIGIVDGLVSEDLDKSDSNCKSMNHLDISIGLAKISEPIDPVAESWSDPPAPLGPLAVLFSSAPLARRT